VTFNGKKYLVNGGSTWVFNGQGAGDTFIFGALGPVTVNGGDGADTVDAGALTGTTWQIDGANAGSLNGAIRFSGVEKLVGCAGSDAFRFVAGGSISGRIDGAGGEDTVDYSALTTGVTIDLGSQTKRVTTDNGTVVRTGDLANMETVFGSTTAADTLIGSNAATSWDIEFFNRVRVNGTAYSGIENLKGGNKTDTFTVYRISLNGNLGVSGEIDGGGGTNDKLVIGAGDDFFGGFRVNLQDSRVTTNTGVTAVGHFSNVETVEMVVPAENTLVGPSGPPRLS
jgi:hypothetical protein